MINLCYFGQFVESACRLVTTPTLNAESCVETIEQKNIPLIQRVIASGVTKIFFSLTQPISLSLGLLHFNLSSKLLMRGEQ